MHLDIQLIHLRLTEAFLEVFSLDWLSRSCSRGRETGRKGWNSPNYTRTGLEIGDNKSWSPSLNNIEPVWDHLHRKWIKRQPASKEELWNIQSFGAQDFCTVQFFHLKMPTFQFYCDCRSQVTINFPLHQSIFLSNKPRSLINIPVLAVCRSLLPRDDPVLFFPLMGSHTTRPLILTVGSAAVWDTGALCWSCLIQVYPTLKQNGMQSHSAFTLRKVKRLSNSAVWIVQWTVRGTSWTSAAVLTFHQWGAVQFSPCRS